MSPKIGTRALSALLLVVAWCPGGSLTSQTPHDCQREVIHQTESIETQFRLHCNLRSVSRTRIIYLNIYLLIFVINETCCSLFLLVISAY